MAIALLDYGAGNLTSVRRGFAAAGAELVDVRTADALAAASGLVVPGVGHFAATLAIDEEWRDTIAALVAAGTPLLGVCLGMQWLFERSEEAPGVGGMALLGGTVTRMSGTEVKIPHVGWNSLALRRSSRLLDGLDEGVQVYFTHSYSAPITDATVAACTHGDEFAAVVERDRVFGVQFHPEKSGAAGIRILRNFVACCRNA